MQVMALVDVENAGERSDGKGRGHAGCPYSTATHPPPDLGFYYSPLASAGRCGLLII